MCFIDYCKAFDRVDHPALWNMMEVIGIPEQRPPAKRPLSNYEFTHASGSIS